MSFLKVKNRAVSSLDSGVNDSVTSWTLAGGEGAKFPTTGDFHVTCEAEIVKCTSRSTDVLTVVRAQEGTSAAAHTSGKAVELRITAGIIEELQETRPSASSFSFLSELDDQIPAHAGAHGQGVASDGTYIYYSNNFDLYKANKAGAQQNVNEDAHLDGTNMDQINHIFVYGDKLYVGSSKSTNEGYIKVFETSDLSYVEEHQVKNYMSEGCCFYEGFWWVPYYNWAKVSRYNAAWAHQADYDLKASYSQGVWTDEHYLYINTTVEPPGYCDVYKWDGTNFFFVQRLALPAEIGIVQGAGKEPGANEVWWADMVSGGDVAGDIVKTSLNFGSSPNEARESAASAYLSADQAIGNTTWTKVEFDTEIFDLGDEFDKTTNHRFTATKGGLYAFSIGGMIEAVNNGTLFRLALKKNGAYVKEARQYTGAAASYPQVVTSGIVQLEAGDYLEAFVYHNHGAARNLSGGLVYSTWIDIAKIA